MLLSPIINSKIAEALKAHDEIKLSTLRLLSSAFNYERIAKQHELSEDEEMVVIKHEVKIRKDAIEAYKAAEGKSTTSSVEELKAKLAKEEKELAILEELLPEQLSDEVLTKMVDEAISQTGASSMTDMGKVIGAVMAKAKGQADGGKVSQMAKAKLS